MNDLILKQTIFHPQGGGQKSDSGTISGVNVIKAIKKGGDILHLMDDTVVFEIGQIVEIAIDPEQRKENSLLHSAGHLVSSIVESTYPCLIPVKAHHWPGECRVEFSINGKGLIDENAILKIINEKLLTVISESREIKTSEECGGVRICNIDFLTPYSCGGTHVRNTSELKGLNCIKVKIKEKIVKMN